MMAKQKQMNLTEETAAQMLENIFRSCKKTANTVPLKTLRAYSNYRKERFSLQRTAIIVILTLFAMLPLLFIPGDFSVTMEYTQGSMNPRYVIRPSAWLPVRQFSARIDGEAQPIYENENGEYIIQPNREGQMTVSLTLINWQITEKTLSVTGVDYAKPRKTDEKITAGKILFFFEDEGSGINGSSISVTGQNGESLPYQFVTDSQCLIIPDTKEPLTIDVPDKCGNVLQIDVVVQADHTNPQLKNSRKAGNRIMFYLADEESGIDADGISVTASSGESLPYQFNTDSQCLIIPDAKESLTIHVPDNSGNVLLITLAVQ